MIETLEFLESFRGECLAAHNQFRSLHGVPPMLWSDELAQGAQSWSERLAEKGFLQYSESQGWGENISMIKLKSNDDRPNGESIVASWYAEVRHYDFGTPRWSKATFRFSQVLWKSSVEFGCGVAKCVSSPTAFVVAFYRPSGNNNFRNEYQSNVPPLSGQQPLVPAAGRPLVAGTVSADTKSPRRLTRMASKHSDYEGSPSHVRGGAANNMNSNHVDNARDYNSNPSSPLLLPAAGGGFVHNLPSTPVKTINANKRAQPMGEVVTG